MKEKRLQVKVLRVGQLSTNCYLVYDNASKKGIVIDPGDDPQFIESTIFELDIKPTAIVATHGHFDHLLAAEELKLAYQIPLLVDLKDKFLLESMASHAKYFLKNVEYLPINSHTSLDVKKGHIIKSGNFSLKIIETPGHTPGGISLYSESEQIIFVGDLIFKEGLTGRIDFSYSCKKDLDKSIAKVLSLPDKTSVYPGHGEEFTISEFKNGRP